MKISDFGVIDRLISAAQADTGSGLAYTDASLEQAVSVIDQKTEVLNRVQQLARDAFSENGNLIEAINTLQKIIDNCESDVEKGAIIDVFIAAARQTDSYWYDSKLFSLRSKK